MAKIEINDDDGTIIFKQRIQYKKLPDLLEELERKFR